MGSRDAEHPHRCREGHRWQHAGPTALVCEIPVHDSETGDLTLVSEGDCPVCSGREDLLVRELHSHYCNTCAGEWDHEGRCLDGWAASCPWCFPAPDAAPAPGARPGPHFHFCPECAKNWQHDASCAAPLRAALPDCSGCRGLSADPAARERVAKPRATFSPFRPRVSPTEIVSNVHGLVMSAVVLTSVAVALTIPILFWSLAPLTPSSVARQRSGPPSTPSESDGAPMVAALPPESGAGSILPNVPPTARRLAPAALPNTTGAQLLHRNGERRGESATSSAHKAPQKEPHVQPDRTAPANGASTAGVNTAGVNTAGTNTAGVNTAGVEEATRTSGARAQSSNPEALPRGGASLDALLQGPPPRLVRVPEPRHDLSTSSAESPRWDRASLSVLTHAIVDIRPVKRIGVPAEAPPAASARTGSELRQQPIRGFVIDEFGHVLTSNRRLGEATSVEVTLFNGRRLGATIVARNWLNDIAVLRLERRGQALIALGDSAALEVGDRVLAFSDESGPDRTLTPATVLTTGAGTGGNLAVDLTPTPDGVGGPLLNHSGQAVGIVIDGALSTGSPRKLTFAVPVDRVKSLLRNLSSRPAAELMSAPEAR